MGRGIRFGLIELDDMLVAGNLHVDYFVLDLFDDGLLIVLRVDLLERDDLAGEGSVGSLVETQKYLPEGSLSQFHRLAKVNLLVLLDLP